jgi:hypothetical protein
LPNLTRIITDDDGVVVKEQNYQFRIFDDEKGFLFRPNSNYIKGYQGIKLSDVVTNKADFANMHLLAEHLYKDTNMISTYRNHKYRPATIEDMSLIIGINLRHTKEFLIRMINLGVIAFDKVICGDETEVRYFVNPLYFMTSKWLSCALYMMFRKQLDTYLTPNVIAWFNKRK